MTCPRCRGLLTACHCWDHSQAFMAVHCLNCGDVIDATILRNRREPLPRGWATDELGEKRPFRRNLTGEESAYDRRH